MGALADADGITTRTIWPRTLRPVTRNLRWLKLSIVGDTSIN